MKKGVYSSTLIIGSIFIGIVYYSFRPHIQKTQIAEINNSVTTPLTKKVLVLNFNPTIESEGNKNLTEVKTWPNPLTLQQQYVDAVKEVSHNSVNYNIIETKIIDDYPIKSSGYHFTDEEYLSCSTARTCNTEMINYQTLIEQYHVCDRVNSGELDELWIWGGPWFGYYEANMSGPNAFPTNGPVITGTTCQKQLNIMGFNYERSVAEMLHDLGHRSEGTMRQVYKNFPTDPVNLYNQYLRYDQTSPNLAGCGTVHFPPNGTSDYDYDNTTSVSNTCEDWLNYPNLTGAKQSFTCERWGCTQLGYLKWWFTHLPHAPGITDGIRNNWWRYVVDYESAITPFILGDFTGTDDTEGDQVNLADYLVFKSGFGTTYTIFDYNSLVANFDQ